MHNTLVLDRLNPVSVFLLTGQSNSLGTTEDPQEPDITPGVDARDAGIAFFWANRFSPTADPQDPLIGDSGGRIVPLCAQQGRKPGTIVWGPEIGFGRGLAMAGTRSFLIVKASRGGGGNRFWLKGSEDDHMYRHVVHTLTRALAALPAGVDFAIRALLYIQGESDSESEAPLAGERLRILARNLRQDLPRAQGMKVLVGGIAAPGPNRDIVRARQAEVPSTDPSFRYIDTLDLQPQLYDRLHFNRAAKLEIGRRLSAAWLAWPSACAS